MTDIIKKITLMAQSHDIGMRQDLAGELRLAFTEMNESLRKIRAGQTVTVEYDLSPAMVDGAVRSKLIALGWTPPGTPDGFAQIPLDPSSGKPRVTNEMKSIHIGEYRFPVALGIGVDGEQTDINVTVPWDTCKAIYKGMARTAMLAAATKETSHD